MSDITTPDNQESANMQTACGMAKTAAKSWKTTTIGIALAFSGFVAFSPNHFGGDEALIVQISKYIHMGGLAALGITAKDFNVTTQEEGVGNRE